MSFFTLRWNKNYVEMLDQRLLPHKVSIVKVKTCSQMCRAIQNMTLRGAPAIGIAAAMGMALKSFELIGEKKELFLRELKQASEDLFLTRPTAVNLKWALSKIDDLINQNISQSNIFIAQALKSFSIDTLEQDIQGNMKMGEYGADLFEKPLNILTHCNAGALATGGYGTALGVIRSIHKRGLLKMVYADETRPVLQGARLTAWELMQDNIPVTLITDNMAGYFMSKGFIDAVITGADRIASNGDTANKIGTYSLSVIAKALGIPMYIAAPLSTIDMTIESGKDIPIEIRDSSEVTAFTGVSLSPHGVKALNPAFDVTPAGNISAIITEKGVVDFPDFKKMKKLFY
jgi:methylthioribose-1-phosphate isomerase